MCKVVQERRAQYSPCTHAEALLKHCSCPALSAQDEVNEHEVLEMVLSSVGVSNGKVGEREVIKWSCLSLYLSWSLQPHRGTTVNWANNVSQLPHGLSMGGGDDKQA